MIQSLPSETFTNRNIHSLANVLSLAQPLGNVIALLAGAVAEASAVAIPRAGATQRPAGDCAVARITRGLVGGERIGEI